MKKRTVALFVALVTSAVAGTSVLSACKLRDEPLTGSMLADFTKGEAETFFASDGWANSEWFNSAWTADNISYEGGKMSLSITENPDGDYTTHNEYFGGEARTYQFFGYGDYEVRMKPSSAVGTVSAFFTCTGDYDIGQDGTPNPWDEIDIEFRGNLKNIVQFNYFVDGVGGHEHEYNLGFDATAEFHEYGFRWTSEYIVWFVDDEPVYKVTASAKNPLPSTPGRILMNHWCGVPDSAGWMGKYEGVSDKTTQYEWVKTSATPVGTIPDDPVIDDTNYEEFAGDWSTIDDIATDFASSTEGLYTVTNDGTSSNITYTDVKASSYQNVKTSVSAYSEGKNWMHIDIANNGEEEVSVRINIRNLTSTINSYGFGDGEVLDTKPNDGTFVYIPAGESVEVEIKYEGVADNFELMIDSARTGSGTYAGDITVSGVKFAVQGEVVIPEEPESHNDGVTINGVNKVFDGDVGGSLYIINTDAENNSMNVTYSGVAGATYKNINAPVKDIASTKNILRAKITNNGTESVTVRGDIISETQVTADTRACNLSATQDGVAVATDLQYGGSTFVIAAGQTVVIEIIYDASKVPSSLQFMIDSSVYGDTATHSGDVTFSEIVFDGEYVPETPEEPDEPGETPSEPQFTNAELTFFSASGYNVAQSGQNVNTIDVTYNGLEDGYCNIGADIATYATDCNTFRVTIKNNGDTQSTVRIDIQGSNKVGKTEACNLSATCTGGSNMYTNTEWGGSFVTIAAGEEVTFTITYEQNGERGTAVHMLIYMDSCDGNFATATGNLTFSGFAFAKV